MRDRSLSGYLVDQVPWAEAADGTATFVLDGEEGRHAAAVRRVRRGERVMVADGAGHWIIGEVVAVMGRDRVELLVTNGGFEAPAQPQITVVQALPKGDRGPLAVELLTEVGVDQIVPWQAVRCITKWSPDKAEKGQQRWQRVAHEAAKQSRRVWQPTVAPLASTSEVIRMCEGAPLALACHEHLATEPLVGVLDTQSVPSEVLIVIGPEGGLTEEESEEFVAAGARLVGLGPEVLRTSSAGAVAAAVVMSRTPRWR